MDKQPKHEHGGDIMVVARKYGIAKEEIVNFSGNVNPLGSPPAAKQAILDNIDCIEEYPDVEYIALRQTIATYIGRGVTAADVIVGNGATELIALFIHTIKPKKAVILSPAYSEYQRELELAGCDCELFGLEEAKAFQVEYTQLVDKLDENTDMFVVCNPNNPTGSVVFVDMMERILAHCQKNNIVVLCDETYVEFTDEEKVSAVGLIQGFENVFVVRGTAKFFAVPGLRLGYGICSNTDVLHEMGRKKEPWSVSSLTAAAGEALFLDSTYIQQTKAFIAAERTRIETVLKSWKNIKLYESFSNFMLIRLLTADANHLTDELLKNKLLVRNAASFPFLDESYIRFCILTPDRNDQLMAALQHLV